MYENMHISEPKWKSWIVQTTTPLFTPDQCKQIIECGHKQPPQTAQTTQASQTKQITRTAQTT